MKKFKMPTVQEFLSKKTIYGPKKEPVWVYLEREMRENIDKKPYNELVGSWLKFLRDLKHFQYREGIKNLKRLQSEAGPGWFFELSDFQKKVLYDLKTNIHQDLIEDLPVRTRKSLSDLGLTLKIPKSMLMKAMTNCIRDPGIFIWELYTSYYKMPPSKLRGEYDINSMILMSSLVFIDLKECIERLEKLTESNVKEEKVPQKKPPKNFKPNVRYGDYLQTNYVPPYSKYSEKKPSKPRPLGNRVRLRTRSSYERLCEDTQFLEKRKERNKLEKPEERKCNYKFWEPPCTLRNSDPKLIAYLSKLKMLKKKAKARHTAPSANAQYHIGGVVFCGGRPHYVLNTVSLLPAGYIPINGGIVTRNGSSLLNIHGYWKFPRDVKEKCDDSCDCLEKWEDAVMEYLEDSKCKCGHLYDFFNEGKLTEKYFYQPTMHGPFWIDYAKIYQTDPMEDFIKDTFQEALMSESINTASTPTIVASGLKEKELLAAFLADLSDTPLIIPHLPQANLLNNLQEWVRKRVKGKISPSVHKRLLLQSQRRWLHLKHMDFRARAYRIPFTLKQLHNMSWAHRNLIQKLFNILLNDFVTRNQLKQLEQTRLWWSTMKSDAYPNEAFIDIFFSYMPGRAKDVFLINPYSAENTKKHGAKTCPIER